MYALSLDYFFLCTSHTIWTTVGPFLLLMPGRSVNSGADIWYARVFFAFHYFGSEPASKGPCKQIPPPPFLRLNRHQRTYNQWEKGNPTRNPSFTSDSVAFPWKKSCTTNLWVGIITRPSGIKLSFELSLFLCVMSVRERSMYAYLWPVAQQYICIWACVFSP